MFFFFDKLDFFVGVNFSKCGRVLKMSVVISRKIITGNVDKYFRQQPFYWKYLVTILLDHCTYKSILFFKQNKRKVILENKINYIYTISVNWK